MKPVSRKNIHPVLHDVRHPKSVNSALYEARQESDQTINPSGGFKFGRFFLAGIFSFVIGAAGYGIYAEGVASDAVSYVSTEVSEGYKSLRSHMSIARIFAFPENTRAGSYSADASFSFGEFSGFFKNLFGVFSAARELIGIAAELSENAPRLFLNGKEGEFLELLKRAHSSISKINTDNLEASLQKTGGINPYSGMIKDAGGMEVLVDTLGAAINFLENPGERRFVLVFANPSEMRPAGGFAGSYGELVIRKGTFAGITVDDIYHPDKFLKEKYIPPIQLQTVTASWGVRDAGWFFNFPDSARATMDMLAMSDIYKDKGVEFDGVISVNVRVMEDILELTGPIEIPEYGITVSKENFLRVIQEEVENGRDAKPGQNPKRVLSVLTPLVMERVNSMDAKNMNKLLSLVLERASNKDIQIYVNDDTLQRFVDEIGFGGTVFDVPLGYIGDYLAVVNANIAGGKTDAFINQHISLHSEIDASGIVKNDLSVRREHSGGNEPESFYNSNNQNFIKIFTLGGAKPTDVSGVTKKAVTKRAYTGYKEYPAVSAVYNTRVQLEEFGIDKYTESGKNVFGAWFSTPAGKANVFNVKYEYAGRPVPIGNGMRYRFVFDKQAGSSGSLEYAIKTPPGYHWVESGSAEYKYATKNIPARISIPLTLAKDE